METYKSVIQSENSRELVLDESDRSEYNTAKEAAVLIPSSPLFTIKEGLKGRGLFAISNGIPPGTLLHVAPTIKVTASEYETHMQHTVLEHYLFKGKSSGTMLLALGYGSLFNHSKHPNVDYRIDPDESFIRYYSSSYRSILEGDELCICYGSCLWFEDASEGESDAMEEDDTPKNFLQGLMLDDDDDADIQ